MPEAIPIEPVASMILSLRSDFGGRMLDTHKRWRALGKLKDGTYLDEKRRIPWKARYRSNQAIAQLEHQKAMMMNHLPVARAISDNEQDIHDGLCDIANAAIDVIAADIKYNALAADIIDDVHTYGPAIAKILLKPGKKLDVKLVNPRNIFPSPRAECLDDCEVIIEDITLPLSAAHRRWSSQEQQRKLTRSALSGGGFLSQPGAGGYNLYETPSDYDHVEGVTTLGAADELNTPLYLHECFFRDSATVDVYDEFWEDGIDTETGAPTRKRRVTTKKQKTYPKGRHVIITCTGEVIVDEPNYDPDGKFPYVLIGGYRWAHELWPISDLFLMAPTVIAYDEMFSLGIDVARHTAYQPIAIDPQSGVDKRTVITRPAQVLWAKQPNNTIRELKLSGMSDSLVQLIPLLRHNMQMGFNTSEESQGFRPRSDVSGRSIELLGQMASVKPGMKYSNIETGVGELCHRLFGYAKKYWPSRKLQVYPVGNDMTMRRTMQDPGLRNSKSPLQTDTQIWDPARMRESDVRIIVEPGSGMPVDPEQEYTGILSQFQLILQLTGGNPVIATKIMPLSYILAHSPLRNKYMLLSRVRELELQNARAEGMEQGVSEAMREASMDDLLGLAYAQAQGLA